MTLNVCGVEAEPRVNRHIGERKLTSCKSIRIEPIDYVAVSVIESIWTATHAAWLGLNVLTLPANDLGQGAAGPQALGYAGYAVGSI